MSETKILKTIFLVLGIGLILWFIVKVITILIPFVLAAILAYILSPLIIRLQMFGFKRSVAVLILYLGFVLIFATALIIIVPGVVNEMSVLRESFPKQLSNTQVILSNFQSDLEHKFPELRGKNIIGGSVDKIEHYFESALASIPSLLMNIFSIFSLIVLIPVVTFFLLLDGRNMIDKFIDYIPSKHAETAVGFICDVDEIIGKFIKGQVLDASLVGAMTIIVLFIFKIDYAIIIGLFGGLANLVPYLGPAAGAIPAIIVCFVKFQNPSMIFSLVVMFGVIQFIDNHIIQPVLISKKVNLSPLGMIFSILAGAEIFGFVGMLLAVPAASIIKTMFHMFLPKLRVWLSR
jgi:predicted PurR-regulated permease PerM